MIIAAGITDQLEISIDEVKRLMVAEQLFRNNHAPSSIPTQGASSKNEVLIAQIVSLIQAIPSISFFYPNNLTASACVGDFSWTKWFNSFKPKDNKDIDQEFLAVIQAKNGHDVCPKPRGIQAKTVSVLQVDVSYAVSWKTMNGMIIACISSTPGIDFQVRFCCPNAEFITTTTTRPPPINNPTCGRAEIKPLLRIARIFGGSRAVPHSWPWQVLYEEGKPCETNRICVETCGGTLLDSYHVLTAAHCIRGKFPEHILITAGIHNRLLSEKNTRQEKKVARIFSHPDWNSETLANDLAILRLSTPVKFNQYVQPACLPGPDPPSNSDVVLIGWGAEQMGGNPYDELKQAQVKVIGECERFWNLFDEENQICVAQTVSGDSACQGDSGGPLLQNYNDQWVVQGVASFVDDCKTNENFPPNIYVKVSAYLTWIKGIIN
ncbi:unnamed protein product [Rotaria socialis]|uniref:Peptidase S1 domain-containing protein n=1 Tax=Rotaria socialis TaxID=392032 RepID=A0A818ZLQ8_9BILA|nr:unnamed protein product [Rotaria socialis]CAF4471180.1 unnamed protein product [Rotaria socialis]